MIVIDSSAILAILYAEAEGDRFRSLLARSDAWLPGSCYVEASINLRRRGYPSDVLARVLKAAQVRLLAGDERQALIAAEADRRYGRGTRHPARLNFGDCLAYAAAIAHDAPLLFKGEDFGHTDVKRAL